MLDGRGAGVTRRRSRAVVEVGDRVAGAGSSSSLPSSPVTSRGLAGLKPDKPFPLFSPVRSPIRSVVGLEGVSDCVQAA